MNADRGVKLEESLNYIKQALTFEPNNGAYLDSLGWAYFKLGKYDQAEENLTKAESHMGTDPTVQEHLGRSLPENRPPETGRRPLGSRRSGMEQNRSRRTGHRSLRQSPAKTRRRQSKTGQGRLAKVAITRGPAAVNQQSPCVSKARVEAMSMWGWAPSPVQAATVFVAAAPLPTPVCSA